MSTAPRSGPWRRPPWPLPRRFPIRFGSVYRVLSAALGIPASRAYVDVGETVEVRMGWAFQGRFARSTVSSATLYPGRTLNRGVQGDVFGGHWLVNGSGDGLAQIELRPAAWARTLGFPVKVQTLTVSVLDPDTLVRSLTNR